MADLMSGTYTYDSLRKKYADFAVPAAKFKIGGTDLMGNKKLDIQSIEANLSLTHAGSVQIVIGGCYDYEKSSFDSQLKAKAVLGNVVEAEFGYGSSTVLVFKGYVAAVDVNFEEEEGITMTITAMDVRRLMMTGGCHYLLHDVKNYSEAFEAVMKPYKKLCTVKVDATNDKLETPLSQTATDYDFITRDLIGTGRAEREFFVLGDKAYFRKPKSAASPVLSLGIGLGLISFERSSGYVDHEIQVVGYDPGGQKKVSGKAKAKTKEKQAQALASPGTVVYTAPDAATEAQAKARAKAIAERAVAECQTGTVRCVGLPQIVPGRFVEFVKMDSTLNKKYYVTEVCHRYDETGFETTFEVGGWK